MLIGIKFSRDYVALTPWARASVAWWFKDLLSQKGYHSKGDWI